MRASEALGEHYVGYDVDVRRKDGIVTPKPVRPCFTAGQCRATVEVSDTGA